MHLYRSHCPISTTSQPSTYIPHRRCSALSHWGAPTSHRSMVVGTAAPPPRTGSVDLLSCHTAAILFLPSCPCPPSSRPLRKPRALARLRTVGVFRFSPSCQRPSPFRPGAAGLFWNNGTASGHSSGPAGGPCDIFSGSPSSSFPSSTGSGAEFHGGTGAGGSHHGSLNNPNSNSFSFFSASLAQRKQSSRDDPEQETLLATTSSLPSSNISVAGNNDDTFSWTPGAKNNVTMQPRQDGQLPKLDVPTVPTTVSSTVPSPSRGNTSPLSPTPRYRSSSNSSSFVRNKSPADSNSKPAIEPDAVNAQSLCPSDSMSLSPSGTVSSLEEQFGSKVSPNGQVQVDFIDPSLASSDERETISDDDCATEHSSVRPRATSALSPTTPVLEQRKSTRSRKDSVGEGPGPRVGNLATSGRNRRQVRSLFERAKEEERVGNHEEARRLLQQCLDLDIRDAHSWLALALLEARCGGVPVKISQFSADNTMHGQVSTGISAASKTTALNERGTTVSNVSKSRNGRSRAQENGVGIARRLFENGVRECPDSVHLLQAWAVMEHRCGNHDTARKLFARGLEIEPDNPYVCQAWGLLEQREGNTQAARDLFMKSVDLRPHPEVCSAWAILEAREGNVDRARDLLRRGLKACKCDSSSSAAAIYRAWAEIEERVGDLVRAREYLSKAVSAQPRVCETYVTLARLEARRGYASKALELLRTAVGLSARPPAVVFNSWAQIEWSSTGKVEEARGILKRGHALHPADPSLLQTLGTLEDRFGNSDLAKQYFAASIRTRPTAPAFVAWALIEEREGNIPEAINLFEQAILTDPLHGAAYNAYGMMEARRGELDRARKIYERGLKCHPSASVWHGYGQLELKLGRNIDRARELFKSGVAQSREDTAFIWHSWGMLELSCKSPVESRRVFLDALKRYPRNSRVLVGAALAYASSSAGYPAEEDVARDFFKRAVAADPAHAHAWQTWGVFEVRHGRLDVAEGLFRRGLRMCPTHGALWQAWGVLETSVGNFAKARQLFSRGAAACPMHVHLYQAWACMEVRAGNIGRARELLDHAVESDPCHGPVWNAYGLLEARHGTLAKAREYFVAGISRSPNHAPLYRTYAQTEATVGNYDRARELFLEGLRRDPRHAPLYHAYAEFEAMFGNVEALANLKRVAEKFFGSEDDATNAIRSGEESLGHVAEAVDDGLEYVAKTTPMELALDNK